MRSSINDAIASTVSDMIEADLKVSFTKKELDKLGIKVVPVSVSAEVIQSIRKSLGVSQSVFAKLLNVSLSSVRQWEQNLRKPSGSTMVLLELLQREPKLLDYRIDLNLTVG
jgi:putative transcriptional regulator